MSHLKCQVIDAMPEFALYNVVFSEHEHNGFTIEQLFQECKRKGIRLSQGDIDAMVHEWSRNNRLYRSETDAEMFKVAEYQL